MIRIDLLPVRPLLVLGLACGLLAGCGWAEWPPEEPTVRATPHLPPAPRKPGGDDDGEPEVAFKPPSDRSASTFVGAEAVIVGRGDTVYELSRRHKVAVRSIIERNGLKPPYHLQVGQRIVLPRTIEHVVKKGETLYSVSRDYDVDTYALARANGLTAPFTVQIGQELRIPAAGTSMASATATRPIRPLVGDRRPATPAAVPTPPAAEGRGFLWPTKGRVISSFGAKGRGLHNDGVNIAAARGTPVRAAENGVVAYAGNEIRGFGNLVLIKHADGWITAYAHNDELKVKRGDRVNKRQVIATVGSTGNVSTPQLHFELRRGKRAVDPEKHLTGSRV